MTWAARIALAAVRAYQLVLGPLIGGGCRFEPSCSAYAIEAIEIHGAARGLLLTLRRVSKCHPFCPPGIDPVPPRTTRI